MAELVARGPRYLVRELVAASWWPGRPAELVRDLVRWPWPVARVPGGHVRAGYPVASDPGTPDPKNWPGCELRGL